MASLSSITSNFPFPAGLKNRLPYPESPWKLSPEVIQRALAGQPALLSTDKEKDFVVNLFNFNKPKGYSISKIEVIVNPAVQASFEAGLLILEVKGKKFPPQWRNEPHAAQRKIAYQRWQESVAQFSPLKIVDSNKNSIQLSHVKILPFWHGTSQPIVNSIKESGFTYFGKHHLLHPGASPGLFPSTDKGYFGSGIYFAEGPFYSLLYGKQLILSMVAMTEPYPVISDRPDAQHCQDMRTLGGGGAFQTYNAHYIPVVSANPENPSCVEYYPCYFNQKPMCAEIVVFNDSQALACFHVTLSSDTPSHSLSTINDFSTCYSACLSGNIEGVKSYVSSNKKCLKERGEVGESLLDAAVIGGHTTLVEWLIEQDDSLLKNRRHDQSTVLHTAASSGHRDIVRIIHKKDSSQYNETDKHGMKPIQVAALREHTSLLELFEELIKKDERFIIWVAQSPCPRSLKHHIDNNPDLLNKTNSVKQTLLHLSAQAGQIENVMFFLERGLNVDAQDTSKRTPLFLAVTKGHVAVVQLLLDRGANITLTADGDETVLHAAAFNNFSNISLLEILLPRKSELIHAQDSDGKTPLHKAVYGNPKPNVVKWLVENGANPNEVNKFGFTPLHWAAMHGHLESVKFLMSQSVRTDVKNANNENPIDLALRFEKDHVMHYFIDPNLEEEIGDDVTDLEDNYRSRIKEASTAGNHLKLAYFLEKLSELYLIKKDYKRTAHYLIQALAVIEQNRLSPIYQAFICSKLEQLEAIFIYNELGMRVPAEQRKYLVDFRKKINEHRESVANSNINHALESNTSFLMALFSSIISNCMAILGEAPTKFACMGLGSISLRSMQSRSNLKMAILIEKETKESRTYFINLARLLEWRLMNLGEAPSADLENEINFVNPGIRLNNTGLSPLGMDGVCELIKSPKELAQIQEKAWLERNPNEILLTLALSEICHLAGDIQLIYDYQTRVNKVLNPTWSFSKWGKNKGIELLRWRIKQNRIPNENHFESQAFNVKKDLYEPLQHVLQALRLYHNLDAKKLSITIDELQQKTVFTPEGAKALKELLDQILQLRLQAHEFHNSKKDTIHHTKAPKDKEYVIEHNLFLSLYRKLILLHEQAEDFIEGKQNSFQAFPKSTLTH